MKGQVNFLFWSIKNSGEVTNKLKLRGFRETSLSTSDFFTLYTTWPHNFIKEKLNNLIEWAFEREGLPYLACNERMRSLLLNSKIDINFGRVKICVKPYILFRNILLGSVLSYTDKLLIFRWVLIVLL